MPSTDVNIPLITNNSGSNVQPADVNVTNASSQQVSSNANLSSTGLSTSFDGTNKRPSVLSGTNMQTQNAPTSANSQNSEAAKKAAKRRSEANETVFKISKGVKTFDFSFEKNLLITGGKFYFNSKSIRNSEFLFH